MNDLENFRSLGLSDSILDALKAKGFEEPSPIQKLTIPLLLSGEKNVIGQAQTGTGKTAAFGIPILEKISRGDGNPQALILSPTRELSIQIAEELNSLKGNESSLRIASFYGGQYIGIQLNRLREGIDVVIGTPGRIMDLMERGKLHFEQLQFAVLDEADEMLDMGFVDDIRQILSATPENKRMLMFSATMPKEILSIAETFMGEYEIVRTKTDTTSPLQTEQIFYEVRRENKLEAITRIIDMEEDLYAMVFCRTKTDVDELAENLTARGYLVDALHGDLAQGQRTRVINSFKRKQFKILIATDVAARGIDVNDLTHVINFSIPQSTEAYVHRIGRTGRAGKKGTAITFVTPGEQRQLIRIKRTINMDIAKRILPSVQDILNAKKKHFATCITEKIASDGHVSYLDFARDLLAISDNPEEILAAVLKEHFNNDLLPENYHDIQEKKPSGVRRGNTRIKLSVGTEDGYIVPRILDLIFDQTGIKSYQLGKIECSDHQTLVNLTAEDADRVIQAFSRNTQGPRAEITDSSMPAPQRERTERAPRRGSGRPERKSLRTEILELGEDGLLENERELENEERRAKRPDLKGKKNPPEKPERKNTSAKEWRRKEKPLDKKFTKRKLEFHAPDKKNFRKKKPFSPGNGPRFRKD